MSVEFNPVVNFKSDTNLIAEAIRKSNEEPKPQAVVSSPVEQDTFEKAQDQVMRDVETQRKADLFQERLKSRKWEKKYLPESDIIYVRQKKVEDGLEYIIEKDGTVKEAGLRVKPTVIIEANSKMAEKFGKIKHKQAPETDKPHKSLWFRSKEVIADIWKFFSVAGTMSVATAKGLFQGAIAATAVLASATIIRGGMQVFKNPKSFEEVFLHPMKTAGKAGKLLALGAGLAALAINVIPARLTANQNSANIEHKMDVEHVN